MPLMVLRVGLQVVRKGCGCFMLKVISFSQALYAMKVGHKFESLVLELGRSKKIKKLFEKLIPIIFCLKVPSNE